MTQSARPSSSATAQRLERSAQKLETGPQVVDRCRAVRPPLRQAELDEHVRPHCRINLLVERAGEISDRGFGGALGE